MLNYVVYSHTDYLEILKIQTDYLNTYEDKILLINSSDIDISDISSQYKNVIYYDDNLPYASRLLVLSELDLEYILLIHDIDVIIIKDDNIINFLHNYVKDNNIDRIDLQYQIREPNNSTELINIEQFNFSLNKQENINYFIYNVNPSIWRLSTLLDIMSEFRNDTYRTIERIEVQYYCSQYKIYKILTDDIKKCGYYHCVSFFQFLHLTHGGKFLPKSNNNLEEYLDIEYKKIVDKYLKSSNREFYINSMW